MPEGGEQYEPQSEGQQSEPVQRLPIESVRTRELADQNLVAYVTGELAYMEANQGSIETRAITEHQRSPAGILEDYLTDIQVNLSRGLTGDTPDFDRSSALRDVTLTGRRAARYGGRACGRPGSQHDAGHRPKSQGDEPSGLLLPVVRVTGTLTSADEHDPVAMGQGDVFGLTTVDV